MTDVVRTLAGDVPAGALGLTNSHDHLFLTTPLFAGDELDDHESAGRHLAQFAANGGRAVVQWSPAATSRRLRAAASLGSVHGVHIVAATGRHRERVYRTGTDIVLASRESLAARFIAEVSARNCGLIKVGTSPDGPTEFERESLAAAAHASLATGAPIAVHLEGGTGHGRVLEELSGHGVEPERVILGHLGRCRDRRETVRAADAGAWVCLDMPSRAHGTTPDSVLAHIEALVAHNGPSQLLLGTDTTTASARVRMDSRALELFALHAQAALRAPIAHVALVHNPSRAWRLRAVAATGLAARSK